MSPDGLTTLMTKLTLDDDDARRAEIDAFLRAETDGNINVPPGRPKTLACIALPGTQLIKARSGWSTKVGNSWCGHEILVAHEMTHRAESFAQEIGFTFHPDQSRDGHGYMDYFPGRYQACHAEVQLLVHYCTTRDKAARDQTSGSNSDNCIDIHVYPFNVCDHCHQFAKRIFVLKDLQVNFYFQWKREYPRCVDCGMILADGYFCQKPRCSNLELWRTAITVVEGCVKLRRSSRTSIKALERLKNSIIANKSEDHLITAKVAAIEELIDSLREFSRIWKEIVGMSKFLCRLCQKASVLS